MKARWQAWMARIDALSERERMLCFAAAAAVLVFGVKTAVFAPLTAKETLLRGQIAQQQGATEGVEKSVAELVQAAAIDPDAPVRDRLRSVQTDADRLAGQLRSMERGVVAPERMAPLLESMLRANARLRMVSMKTLPVTPLSAVLKEGTGSAQPAAAQQPAAIPQLAAVAQAATPAPADPKAQEAAAPAAPPEPELLYRHGVELTVRGSYLDLVDYMNTLQSLPTQLFWGKAQLEVEQYPTARLTLTLYTMSLDDKWMKL